ncbi:Chemotaxis protein methyltransferase [Paraconexibacter sp. AEG42_29]|uniref:protein-glutamate O-methyltransferase n=1 Tax=Paraconexibacter sp. AEG42_29 TaxID=2997339 RepID=A0AAU7AP27_9ACTN
MTAEPRSPLPPRRPLSSAAVPAAPSRTRPPLRPVAGRAGDAPAARAGSDDFTVFCEGVRRLCGIDLSQYKRAQMERRVRTFVERQGEPDLPTYLHRMQKDKAELEAFLDRVTINVSQLWRNPDQWTRLERTVLPELFAQGPGLKAWSAGCSYGAEAYTLAALSRTVAAKLGGGKRIEITGTDIDRRIVERARRGTFTADDARDAPSALLQRFFEPAGEGTWTARAELRPLVRFEAADLLRIPARKEQYDLILCRNTVIYFTDDVRDALHAKLVESLRPGGYLVVGSTERVAHTTQLGLTPAFPFTYKKGEA